jgi:hypothetical protein
VGHSRQRKTTGLHRQSPEAGSEEEMKITFVFKSKINRKRQKFSIDIDKACAMELFKSDLRGVEVWLKDNALTVEFNLDDIENYYAIVNHLEAQREEPTKAIEHPPIIECHSWEVYQMKKQAWNDYLDHMGYP